MQKDLREGEKRVSAIPRPASTVVLLDKEARVYLTKRPKTMKFLGGFHVFPGGAVEASDYFSESDSQQKWRPTGDFHFAHYIAAARELFEEAGILLCQSAGGLPVLVSEETKMEYRHLLIAKKMTFWELLEREQLSFHPQALNYFGHFITPKEKPIRYDTRFFLAHLPEGQSPTPDPNEIDEGSWYTPADALSAFQNRQIRLARPTIHALKSINRYVNDGELTVLNQENV